MRICTSEKAEVNKKGEQSRMKKIIRALTGLLAVFFAVSCMNLTTYAANQSVATNGNQKIKITIKVADENGQALEGASVNMTAKDYNPFAKTQNLSLTAVTDKNGTATFKISNTYDLVTGYSVSKEEINTVTKKLSDFIGLTKTSRSYKVSTTEKKFTVNFYDAAGNVIKDETVGYGKAATAPEAPAYNGVLNYKMVFKGWNTEFSSVKSNLDVKAVYDKTSKDTYYQLRLVNPVKAEDGASLAISNSNPKFVDIFADKDIEENENGVVDMGDGTAVTIEQQMRISNFKINVASSNSSRYYGETNEDGSQTVVYVVSEDLMYKTAFNNIDWNRVKRSAKQIFGTADAWTAYYTVRFYDAAGNVIDTQKIEEGQAATAPEAPEYNGDLKYNMVFTEWDTDFSNVSGALDVKPVYDKTSKNKYYQLRLVNPLQPENDGASLALSNSNPKFVDIFGKNAEYVEDENGVIEMGDGVSVKVEDFMNIATYKVNINSSNLSKYHSVTNEDGSQTIVYTPNADVTMTTSFESIDWFKVKKSANQVFGKADAWTTYYTVRFYDAAGNVIDTQKIEEGKAATAPEAPEYNGNGKYIYYFAGWDKKFDVVTGALDVKPVYEKPDFTAREYNPLAAFHVTLPNGIDVCVTNNHKRINYVFGSDEDVYEDENGMIDMGDGTFITLDSLTSAQNNLSLNTKNRYYKYIKLEDIDGAIYLVYTNDEGNKMKAAASSIDWKSLVHIENNKLYVYGTAVWEEVAAVEAVEEPEAE